MQNYKEKSTIKNKKSYWRLHIKGCSRENGYSPRYVLMGNWISGA